MSLPGFDEWKERLPREWDDPRVACVACGEDDCDCGMDGVASPHAEEADKAHGRYPSGAPAGASVSSNDRTDPASPCTARDDALDPACAVGVK